MRQSAACHVTRHRMTHRAIRTLRQRSSLAPTSSKASPELRLTYDAWSRMLNHQRRWAYQSADGQTDADPPVATAWVASFDQFLADMGQRPAGTQLTRLDASRPYGPSNCHWARPSLSGLPSPNSRYLITFDGVTLSVSQWARRLNTSPSPIYRRYHRGLRGAAALGYPVAETIK